MSTHLGTIYAPMHTDLPEELNNLSLLQFFGGVKNGKMLQITIGYELYRSESRLLLNKEQVKQLRDMLNTYLDEES